MVCPTCKNYRDTPMHEYGCPTKTPRVSLDDDNDDIGATPWEAFLAWAGSKLQWRKR